MPIEIYIAVLAASLCLIVLTILLVTAAIFLKRKLDLMQENAVQIKQELSELIQESQSAVKELRQTAANATRSMENIEHITHTARGWTDRADRLVDAVGAIAEPPIFFVSKKAQTIGEIVSGIAQLLLNPKR